LPEIPICFASLGRIIGSIRWVSFRKTCDV
jgi:hypothetical protein